MNKKILQFFLILLIGLTLSLWITTQIFAHITNYNPVLKPVIGKFYFPYSIIVWIFKYKKSAPRLTDLSLLLIGVFNSIYSIFIYILLCKRGQKDTHGSGRYSKPRELKKKGYLDRKIPKKGKLYKDGVILGRTTTSKTIIDNEKTHILVVAKSRSGKGTGIILPTLVNWRGSVICFDIKGENFKTTSKYRQDYFGNKVLRLAPYDALGGSKYNPLKEIRIRTPYEVRDCEIIANILTQPERGKSRDHFHVSANTVFVSVFLHLLYKDENASLSDVYEFMTSPSKTQEEKFSDLLKERYESDKNIIRNIYGNKYEDGVHPTIVQGATEMLEKSSRERSSVISTALNKLAIFKDPIIKKNTSSSDFRIKDLMDNDNPVSLYFCAQQEELDALGLYIRIFITQFIGISMRKEKHKHKCLMMLDEFPAYGKIELMDIALGFVASYGIKMVLIAQNTEQIKAVYGQVNSIRQGCASSVFYAPTATEYETCKLISDMLGSKTIYYDTQSGKKYGGFFDGNVNINKKSRRLMEPEEVIPQLGDENNIIMLGGCYPTFGRIIKYYEEPYLDQKIFNLEERENPKNWANIDKLRS